MVYLCFFFLILLILGFLEMRHCHLFNFSLFAQRIMAMTYLKKNNNNISFEEKRFWRNVLLEKKKKKQENVLSSVIEIQRKNKKKILSVWVFSLPINNLFIRASMVFVYRRLTVNFILNEVKTKNHIQCEYCYSVNS